MGAHLIDHPYWALGLKYPSSIEATSTPWGMDSKNQPASYPLATQAVYHFPARGSQPPVKMTWCDGGLMPGRPDALPESVTLDRGGGVILIGEKGILLHETYGSKPRLFPESLMEEAQRVPKTHPPIQTADGPKRSAPHRMNWIDAIRERSKTTCPFEYAGPLTETMLLGVVALRTGQGRRIDYDGEAGKITNVSEANQYLRREPRKGWVIYCASRSGCARWVAGVEPCGPAKPPGVAKSLGASPFELRPQPPGLRQRNPEERPHRSIPSWLVAVHESRATSVQ